MDVTSVNRVPGLLDEARAVLKRHFGYDDFRPAQRRVLASILAGRDVLGVLPTGAGKSVCFQVPAMLRSGLTLVISPLISLMQDQVESARRKGLPAAFINSTLDAETQQGVLLAVRRGECRLLYVAPERLPRLSHELQRIGVQPACLAVDEAHCISEWGHDFRPSYRLVGKGREAFGWPRAIALTGSATPQVRVDIQRSLGLGARAKCDVHVASFDRPNLRFEVGEVRNDVRRLSAVFTEISAARGSAIVYAPTRNLTESIARLLHNRGIHTLPYHAGLTKTRRAETLERFIGGDVRVVSATCAFGMGIDKPDVRLVLHWSMPPTLESYYQEAGRAGRDGASSRCLLLHAWRDIHLLEMQLETTFPPEKAVEEAWRDRVAYKKLPNNVQASVDRLRSELRPEHGPVDWTTVRKRKELARERLSAMERYATVAGCRREALLGWFGEKGVRCSGCDRCHASGRRSISSWRGRLRWR
ncbi:MAG TPA: ATP-dependent DNA helicase RecQ [Gemmatimonadales bacterium]|nr:ATP-dependent DNA helicase RecQ [Gemmatimonadales bacterium]